MKELMDLGKQWGELVCSRIQGNPAAGLGNRDYGTFQILFLFILFTVLA